MTCPLAWWTARDVWAYLVSRSVPWHPIYDYEDCGLTREKNRNTGWLSTDGASEGRLIWLRRHFPEQWERLATEFPDVRRFT